MAIITYQTGFYSTLNSIIGSVGVCFEIFAVAFLVASVWHLTLKFRCQKGGAHYWEDIQQKTTGWVINHQCKKCGRYYI